MFILKDSATYDMSVGIQSSYQSVKSQVLFYDRGGHFFSCWNYNSKIYLVMGVYIYVCPLILDSYESF